MRGWRLLACLVDGFCELLTYLDWAHKSSDILQGCGTCGASQCNILSCSSLLVGCDQEQYRMGYIECNVFPPLTTVTQRNRQQSPFNWLSFTPTTLPLSGRCFLPWADVTNSTEKPWRSRFHLHNTVPRQRCSSLRSITAHPPLCFSFSTDSKLFYLS